MPETIIEPTHGVQGVWRGLQEAWVYRELLFFLVWRDVKVRYKQTALGALWAVLQPVLTMVVFTVFLGRLARVPSDGVPYEVFTFAALLPWQLFAHALSESGNSLVANQHLLTKVYFPRLVIPTSAVLAGLVDYGIQLVVLLAMIVLYGIAITPLVLLAPVFAVLGVAAALGAGLWLSALNVRYRDVRYTLPFLVQVGLFATPVAYPSSLLPEPWRTVYGLNPMAGVVEGTRWALVGAPAPPLGMLLLSAGVTVLLLVGGLVYFRGTERSFADLV
ncbi:MAG: ABC transporter permease [Chloroflexi bacterium]|nr:ABC transporter permease [Chloroflexota bacterium]